MGTGVQCVLQRMHNMTAESASGALHSEREMCYTLFVLLLNACSVSIGFFVLA